MTFRRILIILFVHFVVMVCYPHYTEAGGMLVGAMSAGIWTVITIIVGIVGAVFFLDRWQKFNGLVTALLIMGALWSALTYLPQDNKIRPIKKVAYGDFPDMGDINKGLKNFHINIEAMVNWVKSSKNKSQKLYDTEGRLKQVIGEM